MSRRQYGRHRGVSESAVRKALAVGRITANPDGTIDPVRADEQWAANTLSRAPGAHPGGAGTRRPGAGGAAPDAGAGPAAHAGGTSLLQARTVNEVVKAQTNKVRLARLKGELVDRSQAIAHVFKLAQSERDAWLNWPARVAPAMARAVGVDPHAMHVALEEVVAMRLAELGPIRMRLE